MNLYSIPEAARKIGRDRSGVYRYCIRHGIGQKAGRSIVLTEMEVLGLSKSMPGVAGNPNFGNGKPKKRPRKKS